MFYTIIECTRSEDLAEEVQKMLDDGWKPQGGVAAMCFGTVELIPYYSQALIKE